MKPFRRIYPDDNTKKIFFDGGINNKFERTIIADNESPDCLNVVFENGAVATRGGTSKLNTLSVGSYAFDALFTREDSSGHETMIAWSNGTAWQLNVTTFSTIASAQSIYTGGVPVYGAQTEGYIFFGNGGNQPYKYDGTYFTRHGIEQASSPSVASQAIGTLTGGYRYKVSYVNSAAVEGDVSTATSTFTAASATIRVTIPTAAVSYGVASRKIYRTEVDGSTYKLLTTVSDNTTTTYDDNTVDGSLGAVAPTDQGKPPNFSVIVFHPSVQRLFFLDPSNPNFLFWTEASNPYVVKATNFDRFGDKSTDILKTLTVLENYLIVGAEKRIHIYYLPSNTPSEWQKIESKSVYGCISPNGIVPFNNGLLLPVVQNNILSGFAHLVGDSVTPSATTLTVITAGSELLSERIESSIFQINSSTVDDINAIVYKNKAYFCVAIGGSQTTANYVLVFDYSYSRIKSVPFSWSLWDGMRVAQFTIYNNKMYYSTNQTTGYIYEMNTSSYVDDATAINSYYYTKEFPGFLNESSNYKDFRYALFLIEMLGNYYMNISSRVDSDLDDGNTQRVSLYSGSTLWNNFLWDNANWGGGVEQQDVKLDLGIASGKRIQFKFSNQNIANQAFKVHWAAFAYNLKGLR
jgi:hypothetical protein